MPRIRRSSTARSLAMRSDFSADTNGSHDEDEDGDDGAYTPRRGSMGGSSVMLDDPRRARERAEADAHLHNYVSDQLERVRGQRDDEWYTSADEIEARPED